MTNPEQQYQTHQEKINTREKIILNPAFIRFSNGFELYQNLLHSKDYEKNKSEINKRMHELYEPPKRSSEDETYEVSIKQELYEIINAALEECQENHFSIETFADKLASLEITNKLLAEWNRQEGEVEEATGMIHVNEVISYENKKDDEISLHLRPTGVESTKLIPKIIDGFQTLAIMLIKGNIKATKISMVSWLFNKQMEKKTRLLFGNEVLIEDTSPDDDDVVAIQQLALRYNTRSLEKYLTTGEKPEVRQIIMTKNEFITQFKKV
jgi:hypothetical protein